MREGSQLDGLSVPEPHTARPFRNKVKPNDPALSRVSNYLLGDYFFELSRVVAVPYLYHLLSGRHGARFRT